MKWPQYPEHKDSGTEWFREVPKHWETATIRRYCRVFAGATPSREQPEYWTDGTIPWLSSGDVNARRITEAMQFITTSGFRSSSTKWIKPGSLVIALAGQGRTKGMVATVEFAATCNQSLGVLEPSSIRLNCHFLAYFLESRYMDIRGLVGDGLRDGLNLEHLRSIGTPLPPRDEQDRIVLFLDRETAKIDALIAKQTRLIELLQEKRKAIIIHAVTRGLTPTGSMVHTGVDWLGMVPAHWTVMSLGTVARLQRGFDLPDRIREEGSYPVVTSAGVTAFHSCPMVKGPGVVTGRYGTIGQVFYVDEDFWPLNTTLFVVDFKGNDPKFVRYLLMTLPFDMDSDKSAVPGVNRNVLHRLRVACPPVEEQAAIGDFVDDETSKIDSLMEKSQHAIDLLRERRASLISAAVTGKIDVSAAMGGAA